MENSHGVLGSGLGNEGSVNSDLRAYFAGPFERQATGITRGARKPVEQPIPRF